MKIKYNLRGNQITSKQFLAPNFYINQNKKPIYSIDDDNNEFEISNLNRVNLFVGVNNSGKSRFLRGMFNAEHIFSHVFENESLDNLIDGLISHKIFEIETESILDEELVKGLKSEYVEFLKKINIADSPYHLYDKVSNHSGRQVYFEEFYDQNINKELIIYDKALKEIVFDFIYKVKEYEQALIYWIENQANEKIYIPILRSLLECQHLNKEQLLNIAKEYYEVKNDGINMVLTGLEMYESVDKIHNSDKIRDIRNFCKFLSQNFFDNQQVDLVPDRVNGRILSFSINDEVIRGINKIGDGLQALILMLYPIYTARDKTWFFIEEPETNLHPGLQRVFVDTLIGNAFLRKKKLRYFFTTHSNHFMDLTLNSEKVSIFQFEKLAENKHRIKTNVKPNKDILDILGINTSSVFLANASIWVEGPTDRKYISFFIKKYCESKNLPFLKEDIDFAFFEYGGNLLAHYIFDDEDVEIEVNNNLVKEKIKSFALSNKIYLLADADNPKPNGIKAKRRESLEELSKSATNFMYQSTILREIENLLPKLIIKNYLKEVVNKAEYSKIEKIEFERADYSTEGLGLFYQKKLKEASILVKNQRLFKAESETLQKDYKIKLCDFTINSKLTYDQLIYDNSILEKIITGLYSFIAN